jgi:ABC-type Na+ efflux pump permease subunit
MKNVNLWFFTFLFCLSFISAQSQLINTSLTLTVRDELGNTVSGVEVKLFETEEDYLKEKNVAFSGVSDSKGVVKLKKLKAISYYVIARKEEKDNSGGGERIGALEEGKFNKATVIIQ